IVSGEAAAVFELYRARLQVELIVRHEYLRRQYLVEARQRANGKPAAIDESLRQHESRIGSRDHRVELGLPAKPKIEPARERVDEPHAGVVACRRILAPGISESDDQPQWVGHGQ